MNSWSCRSNRLTHKAKANRNNRDQVGEIAPWLACRQFRHTNPPSLHCRLQIRGKYVV